MAQYPVLEIFLTAIGIMHCAILLLGDGVDGEIAAQQIILQCHIRRGVAGKAGVTMPLFAFDAGEGILLLGVRMQEDREISSHRAKSQRQQLFGQCPDHHIVPLVDRQP